jgi:hypothetical protein
MIGVLIGALIVAAVALYMLRGGTRSCTYRLEGVMLDGSVIEVCESCPRVRVYIIDRDGEPAEIVELERVDGESAGEAILRVYRAQHGELDECLDCDDIDA